MPMDGKNRPRAGKSLGSILDAARTTRYQIAMLHFPKFALHGARVAALSGCDDGDCAHNAPDPAPRECLLHACGLLPHQLVTVRQIHGIAIVQADPTCRPDADGLITNRVDVALGITVADCVPLYLLAPEHHAIALLHAGREGTRGNIAAAGITALQETYGVPPSALYALIGPSAGPCCYEVDDACAEDFRQAGLPATGRRIDLWEANRLQLTAAGLLSERIEIVRHCTICGGGFHSYRAHQTPQRNLAILALN